MTRPTHVGVAATATLSVATALGHVIYPAVLWAAARGRTPAPPTTPATWPTITVLIPAYREAGELADKVADVRANGYPGALDILVVAEDPETAAAARHAGVRVVQPDRRLGKAQAINVGMEHVATAIVVLTDANNRLAAGSLAALVRHFDDPSVGGVAGEKVEADGGGEELYWRFESFLKRRESALGTTIGMVGELGAVRRSAWEAIPPDVSSDDLWIALDLAERGHAVRYEPEARSIDPPVGAADAQWQRRTRILAGSLYVFWRKRHLIARRHPVVALQIVGHKLWRSTVGPIAHVALLVMAGRHPRGPIAAAWLGGNAAALAALGWRERGHRLPRPLSAPAQVVYLQLVALGGMVRFARRDRVLRWDKPAR